MSLVCAAATDRIQSTLTWPPGSTATVGYILDCTGEPITGHHVCIAGTRIQLSYSRTLGLMFTRTGTPNGVWSATGHGISDWTVPHSIIWTWDGTTPALYVDTEPVALSASSPGAAYFSSSGIAVVGNHPTSSLPAGSGTQISHVTHHNAVLTAAQRYVVATYGTVNASRQAYWQLAGDRLDETDNGRDLNVTSGVPTVSSTDPIPVTSAENTPYDPLAPIRRSVVDDPLDANSTAWAQRFNLYAFDRVASTIFGEAPGVYIARETDDLYTVTGGSMGAVQFPVPAVAVNGGGDDYPLVVMAPFQVAGQSYPQVELRCWQAVIDHGAKTVSASNVNLIYYNSDGVERNTGGTVISDGRHFSGSNNTGSGMSYTTGMIRRREVQELLKYGTQIRHGIRAAMNGAIVSADYRLPAVRSDQSGATSSTQFPMGTRFRLKASVDVNARTVPNPADNGATKLPDDDPHTKLLRGLAWTMQNYGIVCLDGTTGDLTLYFENDVTADWAAFGIDGIDPAPSAPPYGNIAWILRDDQLPTPDIPRTSTDGIPWDQFEVVADQEFFETPTTTARLIFDGRTRNAWSLNAGPNWPVDGGWSQLADTNLCPYFPNTPTLQGVLYDGMRANFDSTSNERCDLQEPGSANPATSPLGGTRCWVWAERLMEKGSPISGRWTYLGPEIHTSSSTGQSQIAMCARNNYERHLERNPPDIANFSSIQFHPSWGTTGWEMPLNEWVVYRLYFKLAGDSSGFCQLWRNGVKLVDFSGPTATAGRGGYLKMAMYRNAGQTGKIRYQVCGFQVFDALVPDPYSGEQNPPPDPPPDPSPPDQITVTCTTPTNAGSYTGVVPYDITLQNKPTGYYLYVGYAPGNISVTRRLADESASNRHVGTLAIPQGAATDQFFYAALHDISNVKIADQVFPITVAYAAAPTVTVSPDAPSVQAGGVTQQFTADVSGTRTWSVNGVNGGNATVGTINAAGLYTSPAAVPTPATVTVAVSIVGEYYTVSDSTVVTITAAPPTPPDTPPPDAGEENPADPPSTSPDPNAPPGVVIVPARRPVSDFLRFRYRSPGIRWRRRRR